ncbi:MAG: hypothetical protein H6Q61_1047 [Firmicutes bacterium]|nr:hypothetical protein [Bacillota bacterium]
MWIANRKQREIPQESTAELGTVTLTGQSTGVYLDGERRNVAVLAPRGYHWAPQREEESLVLSCGEERAPCIIGMRNQGAGEHSPGPGEVWISVAPASGIHLKSDGSIELVGPVYINGNLLEVPSDEEA